MATWEDTLRTCVGFLMAAAAVALSACGGNTSSPDTEKDAGGPGKFGGPQAKSGKLDLLLVVDNSWSMGDKQAVLDASAKTLISRLTNPRCVDSNGNPTAAQPANAGEDCPSGSSREMPP